MQEGPGHLQVTLVVYHGTHLLSVLRAVTDRVEVARDGHQGRALQGIGLIAERHGGDRGRLCCGGLVICGFESPWVVVSVCYSFLSRFSYLLSLFLLLLFFLFLFSFLCSQCSLFLGCFFVFLSCFSFFLFLCRSFVLLCFVLFALLVC